MEQVSGFNAKASGCVFHDCLYIDAHWLPLARVEVEWRVIRGQAVRPLGGVGRCGLASVLVVSFFTRDFLGYGFHGYKALACWCDPAGGAGAL